MNVRLQFFSQLKQIAGTSDLELEVPEGATVATLLSKLYLRLPGLRNYDSSILVGAGVEFVGRDYVLRKGEEISVMPPVQGG